MKKAIRLLKDIYERRTTALCLLVAAIVLAIDYVTGKNIEFPILYALPAGMAAWRAKKQAAYLIAILLPLARIGFHIPWHETQSLAFAVFNSLITAVALLLYAWLVARTGWQTRALEKKVRTLEGILPICAACKKIRNENGEFEQMEKYITEHSEAMFSHGLCPECAKRLYPEFYKGKA